MRSATVFLLALALALALTVAVILAAARPGAPGGCTARVSLYGRTVPGAATCDGRAAP